MIYEREKQAFPEKNHTEGGHIMHSDTGVAVISYTNGMDALGVTNILYESDCSRDESAHSSPSYRLHFVTEGEGVVYAASEELPVRRGDVIAVPPASAYSIESTRALRYICINYNGSEARILARQVGIARVAKLYSGFDELCGLWESLISIPGSLAFTRAKGVIYYTFTEILKRMSEDFSFREGISAPQRIKSFVDDNFTNCELTLNYLSDKLSYHPNYISSVFNEEYGLSIVKYINILRIRHACFLMEQGIRSLKNLAPLCGFNNVDYFSSVFKAQMGVTPKAHIKHITSSGTTL
jgi:AraC-like DNA-binding protein